jgi:mono/diheme cytochrome c family protein
MDVGRWRVAGAVLLLSLAVTGWESPTPAGDAPDAGAIRPLLDRYCVACHGTKRAAGGLNLTAVPADADPRFWARVWGRVRSRQMPPPEQPQPTPEQREQMAIWIEGVFARHTLQGQPDPGPLLSRRLNAREVRNSLRDLARGNGNALPRRVAYKARPDGSTNLYDAIIPPPEHPCAFVTRILPPDTSDGGFDTLSTNLSIPPFLLEKYLRCSKTLLDEMFTLNPGLGSSYQWPLYQNLTRLQRGPLPKDVTAWQALLTFLQEFAGRAFRRPVAIADVEKYARLFERGQENGEDFETAIRPALQAILASPRFTLLWSEGSAPSKEPVRPLDDHELASRLSYFLWSSGPDRELFQLAGQGKLRDPEVLEQQARRMLKDRRILTGLMEGFLGQWLQLERLERSAPDAERYPAYFQNNLAELMRQELLLFADAILVEDRSIVEFLDADWGFLCYPLAQHYGVEAFPGKKPPSNAAPPWYRVQYPDRRRGGILTMGKVLTGTSQSVRTSPVHRGKWILETILGTPPPPPPPEVDNQLKDAPEGEKNLTVPQRLARHRDNLACASCHKLIDPLGMAFENFDPVGRWRDKDQDQVIEPRGTWIGQEFNSIVELKTLLVAQKAEFVRTFTERLLVYALGRKLEFYDTATVKGIAGAVSRDDYRLSRAVVGVVLSYPFRNCRTGAPSE